MNVKVQQEDGPQLPGWVLRWGLLVAEEAAPPTGMGTVSADSSARAQASSRSARGQWRRERPGESSVVPTGSASTRWVCATQRPRPWMALGAVPTYEQEQGA